MAAAQKRRAPRVAAPKSKGERMCAACRARAPRESLLRFVVDAEGEVWVDAFLKAPGRGVHLCYTAECLSLAVKKRAFQQSLKRSLPPLSLETLISRVSEAQARKLDDLISLSRRRRVSVSGLNVLTSSASKLRLLILASDIAENSAHQLESKASCEVIRYGDSASLGVTQGKEKRVAIGITDPKLASLIAQEFHRYRQLSVAS